VSDALQSLENQYFYLTSNLATLQAKYPNEPEKSQFMTQYVNSRRNYFNSINKIFHDDDPAIISLCKQMKQQQAVIKKEVDTMSDVAKLLNDITTAVQVGAKLASLAG
jgi:hypothetical protein